MALHVTHLRAITNEYSLLLVTFLKTMHNSVLVCKNRLMLNSKTMPSSRGLMEFTKKDNYFQEKNNNLSIKIEIFLLDRNLNNNINMGYTIKNPKIIM